MMNEDLDNIMWYLHLNTSTTKYVNIIILKYSKMNDSKYMDN